MFGRGDNETHVWVRQDVFEVLVENNGTFPKGWKPSRKRGRNSTSSTSTSTNKNNNTNHDGEHWGWIRAKAVPSSEEPRSENPYGHVQLRKTKRNSNSSNSNHHPGSPSWGSPRNQSVLPQNALLQLTIDDDEFAPDYLQYRSVKFQQRQDEDGSSSSVVMANSWWRLGEMPPVDLTNLTHLHEPAVVYCLQRRYEMDEIYTYTGKILLALNPFRTCHDLYGEQVMERYWMTSTLDDDISERPQPHVYATAQDAYGCMMRAMGGYSHGETENQSILVSGESGAGKTVTTKIIMSYLTTLSRRHLRSSASTNDHSDIESQVLQSNPILESFGNARTLRNDNSSRFGKFIEIRFHSTGCVAAASIETYLLEKVRLITQATGERNYHIFYELLGGLPQKERRELLVGNRSAQDFTMTSVSGTFDRRDGVNDRETFRELRQALQIIGFSRVEQTELFTVCVALLHASNLTFNAPEEEASELNRSNPSLKPALTLLGVNAETLEKALCYSFFEARGETLYKNQSIQQATKALEAMLKVTYSALFNHIVRRVNQSIKVEQQTDEHCQSKEQTAYIGVLDIFGFESFQVNSFEQLCINFCNEALQQQFNRFVFKQEQQDYEREGIDWSFISFPDNQDVLDLIEKKHTGILSILDEQSFLRTCNDQTFARALYDKCSAHERFQASNQQKIQGSFSIKHYAGSVEYDTYSFLEKNKDDLPKETRDLLISSSNNFISQLGSQLTVSGSNQKNGQRGGTRKPPLRKASSSLVKESVGSQFTRQLGDLRTRINQTTPHYVRCLKPNDSLIPKNFQHLVIADQLRCAGVLEAIRVSRVGFPQRYLHKAFVQRYRVLFTAKMDEFIKRRRGSPVDQCSFLVKEAGKKISECTVKVDSMGKRLEVDELQAGIQMGRTKVFLRNFAFDALEQLRTRRLEKAAIAIQRMMRGFNARLDFLIALEAILILQGFFRRINALQAAYRRRRHRAATCIQCMWRMIGAERYFLSALYIAQWSQSAYRGIVAREVCAFLLLEDKAQVLQCAWRRYRAVSLLHGAKTIGSFLQGYVLVKRAQKELKMLKKEAKDLRAVAKERDRFQQEALRLRRVLENNKSDRSSSVYERGIPEKESREVEQLKHEIRRLQEQLQRHSTNDELRSLAEESAAKDMELETLRREIAALRHGPTRSPVRRPLSVLTSPPLQTKSRIPRRDKPDGTTRTTILSPFTNFLKATPKPAELEQHDTYEGDSQAGNRSVTSRSLLDSTPDDFTIMQVSPDARQGQSKERLPTEEFGSASSGPAYKGEVSYFHHAIRHGNESRVRQIIEESDVLELLVNECDHSSRSPLHMAVMASSLAIVALLLEHDAVANAQDAEGNTPLHLAAEAQIVSLLLERGRANPNIPNHHGLSALHFAVQRQDPGAIQQLLRCGADVNAADDLKWYTPLHIVAHPEYGNGRRGESRAQKSHRLRPRIASMLCGVTSPSEADPNSRDSEGNTPLHHTVTLHTVDACDVLSIFLGKGAQPNIVNNRGQTALHLLCHNDSLRHLNIMQEMLHDMLFHGANPNMASRTGCTALHLCLYHHDVDSAVQLVNRGAQLHLLWTRPVRWSVFWDDMGESQVLPLDMVQDENDLHRLLAAISKPQKWSPSRSWCMNCRAMLGTFARALHCKHCGRLVCGSCCNRSLGPQFFPKSFEVYESSWVCIVCEKILVSRREDDECSATQPTTSFLEEDDDRVVL